MKFQGATIPWTTAVAAALLLLLGSGSTAQAQFNGAVYTTTSTGTVVNNNLYDFREDVYINGGPQNPTGAGLPNGIYYFQVTDPSGAALLSLDDAVCRQLTVSGGVVAGATGPCPHLNGAFNPSNGSTPVQLFPFDFTPNPGREYKVWLIAQSSAVAGCTPSVSLTDPKVLIFPNSCAKTDNFKVRARACDPNCTNPDLLVSGKKYYDLNTNGIFDLGEPTIAGFRIDVYIGGSLTPLTTFTDAAGTWSLLLESGTSFRACEVLPSTGGWVQTGPLVGATVSGATADASRCWVGTVGLQDIGGLNFFNVCLGAGGGLTLGFWSNKNGQAFFGSDDLALMVSLNLRDAAGAHFNPASYDQFRSWLLSANATNMSYMLSAQLAAMELNVLNLFVTGGSWVSAGANPGACSVPVNQAGFITVSSLMGDADRELGLDGYTPAGDPERVCQEFKKNALDAANNNRNFVRLTPCTPSY